MEITEHIDGLYTVQCNLDLDQLRKSCDKLYDIIPKSVQIDDQSGYGIQGNVGIMTKLFSKYNVLLYPLPGLSDLYWNIRNAFHACVDKRGSVKESCYIQSWLNYYHKGQFIGWHGHGQTSWNTWHGFFCLNVEPNSCTTYKWPDDPNRKDVLIEIHGKNNMMVMGATEDDEHRTTEWTEDEPRITVAFDIVPLRLLQVNYMNAEKWPSGMLNRWIPI